MPSVRGLGGPPEVQNALAIMKDRIKVDVPRLSQANINGFT